jgi:hypothetical protein
MSGWACRSLAVMNCFQSGSPPAEIFRYSWQREGHRNEYEKVVNCFQSGSSPAEIFRYSWQRVYAVIASASCCELLSKWFATRWNFQIFVTTMSGWACRSLAVMNCFQSGSPPAEIFRYSWQPHSSCASANFVVNCFQTEIFRYSWQLWLWCLSWITCCELLSNWKFQIFVTTKRNVRQLVEGCELLSNWNFQIFVTTI